MSLPLRISFTKIQRTRSGVKLGKCQFMVGMFSGHIVSSKGIEVDKSKIKIIANCLPLNVLRTLDHFLGMLIFTGDLSRILV